MNVGAVVVGSNVGANVGALEFIKAVGTRAGMYVGAALVGNEVVVAYTGCSVVGTGVVGNEVVGAYTGKDVVVLFIVNQ